MSSEQNFNLYTAADFERYHSGKMTQQEMYALEKAALDDPFLNDALEGYKLTKSPVADIREVKNRLEDRNKKNRKTAFLQPLIKIAAILLLVGGLGWLLLKDENNSADEKVVL